MDFFGHREGLLVDEEYGNKTRDNRMKVSGRIRQEFIGKSSGLSPDDQTLLIKWDDLFHLEVHNGLLSFAQEIIALVNEQKPPSIGPSTDPYAYSAFVNRSCEMGWMIVKLLPFLQPSESAFGSEWGTKRAVLDNSLRYMMERFSETGNTMAKSFIAMIEKKFRFKDTLCYFDSTYVA